MIDNEEALDKLTQYAKTLDIQIEKWEMARKGPQENWNPVIREITILPPTTIIKMSAIFVPGFGVEKPTTTGLLHIGNSDGQS